MQKSARSLHGNRAAVLKHLQAKYVLAAVLCPHEIVQKNEHGKNLDFVAAFALRPCDSVRQSCGVKHNTLRLPHDTQKFVVVERCTAAARPM